MDVGQHFGPAARRELSGARAVTCAAVCRARWPREAGSRHSAPLAGRHGGAVRRGRQRGGGGRGQTAQAARCSAARWTWSTRAGGRKVEMPLTETKDAGGSGWGRGVRRSVSGAFRWACGEWGRPRSCWLWRLQLTGQGGPGGLSPVLTLRDGAGLPRTRAPVPRTHVPWSSEHLTWEHLKVST